MIVEYTDLVRVVGNSINYSSLDIAIKKVGNTREEDNISLYKDRVPQFFIIKKLLEINDVFVKCNKINYSILDNKIEEINKKRQCNIELLELDLYSSNLIEFYIIKTFIEKSL